MIAIVAGCGNNFTSVQMALKRLGYSSEVTTSHKQIQSASHVILPGVGNAGTAMKNLSALNLIHCIAELKQPVLGICLGMQILFEFSTEGNVNGLGIFPGKIFKFDYQPGYPIPHMGWSVLQSVGSENELLLDIPKKSYVYFVHSYFALPGEYTQATTHYLSTFASIVKKENFCGMQFHPEKSGKIGQLLLKNFLHLKR